MAKSIALSSLGDAISKELTMYHEHVLSSVNNLSEQASKDLVANTKANAPVGNRKKFKKQIASKLLEKSMHGNTYVWYVKPPDYRLTHLLVHGHATRNGGRTAPNPFLHNAIDEVFPAYEKAIEEAVKNGK